jgi:hypothetical protein
VEKNRSGNRFLRVSPGVDLKDEKYRVLAEREAMIALAGSLASLRYRGAPRRDLVFSQSDLEGLSFAAAHTGESQEELNSNLDRLAAKTAQLKFGRPATA